MKHSLSFLVRFISLLAFAGVAHADLSDAPGPFSVETVNTVKVRDEKRGKEIEALVRFPKGNGPFPLIVFSHGFGAGKEAYGPVSEMWASHGYVVVHPQHADASAGARLRESARPDDAGGKEAATQDDRRQRLREMLREGRTSGSGFNSPGAAAQRVSDVVAMLDGVAQIEKALPALAGKIDRERIGVAGHSFGAATALLIGGATTTSQGGERSLADPRVRCILPFSPSGAGEYGFSDSSWKPLMVPALFITGTRDLRPGHESDWRREAFDKSAAGGKYLLILDGATHFSFGGGPGGMAGRASGGATDDYTKVVKAVSTAFWQATLKKEATARQSLATERVKGLDVKVKSFETR